MAFWRPRSHTPNSNLLIFENTGANAYALAFSDTIVGNGAIGEKVVADLDGDGLIEIAFSGLNGWGFVYESPADDTWRLTWKDSTGMSAANAVEGGAGTTTIGVNLRGQFRT